MSLFDNEEEPKPDNSKDQKVVVIFEDGKAYIETPEENPIDYPHLLQAIAALQSLKRHMEDTLQEYKDSQKTKNKGFS